MERPSTEAADRLVSLCVGVKTVRNLKLGIECPFICGRSWVRLQENADTVAYDR